MKRAVYLCGLSSILAMWSCGGGPSANSADDAPGASDDGDSSAAVAKAEPITAAKADSSEPPAEEGIPTQCAVEGDVCYPPKRFVKALCAHDYPAVAVVLMAQGTPWTRAYTAGEVRAWNASGGGASNEKIPADEEVIVVRHRKPRKGGMQVSGAGDSYDVMRWDGSCVTLDRGELRFDAPPRLKNARIIWKTLEIAQRDVLKEESSLRPIYLNHRKHCKGVSMGVVSKKCVKADTAFSEALAAFIRDNGGVPAPKKLPEL